MNFFTAFLHQPIVNNFQACNFLDAILCALNRDAPPMLCTFNIQHQILCTDGIWAWPQGLGWETDGLPESELVRSISKRRVLITSLNFDFSIFLPPSNQILFLTSTTTVLSQ